jgi:uncharacterized membrane protein
MIKLIGILVVAVGFAFRINTLLVVMLAGIVTGLLSGLGFNEIISLFGTYFVEYRYMSIPVLLMVPVIGLLERYGLQERAETMIRRAAGATAGRVVLTYQALRAVTIALGVRIGSHAEMVRPLVVPMAEGAASGGKPLDPESRADIRAHAAAGENVGNFFAEDIFIGIGAILLMKGFFESHGLNVGVWDMALWGLPTAVFALGIGWWRFRALDRRIAARRSAAQMESHDVAQP